MIKSILDTDLYKFSVSNAYFQLYPLAEGTFKFNDRNKEKFLSNLNLWDHVINHFTELVLTDEECEWCIANIPFIPRNYWEWLKSFRFDASKIKYWLDEDGVFQCEVTDKLYACTLWEIAILATQSMIRNTVLGVEINMERIIQILREKIEFANENNIPFAEFGTRRRANFEVQDAVIQTLKNESKTCTGTSNVYFAKKYDMKVSGTFPHEWVMFHAGVFGYKRANYLSLEDWVKVYDGDLGTALIDTYTTDSFLRTLTRKQAHLFAGFRQDSGDEFVIGDKIITRLKEFNIDPKSKVIIFSNALNMQKAKEIKDYFEGKVKVGFGIGTNLTCDLGIEDYKPANIVMKLSQCRMSGKDPWEKCIKISDDLGKHMGDDYEFEIAKYELHLQ